MSQTRAWSMIELVSKGATMAIRTPMYPDRPLRPDGAPRSQIDSPTPATTFDREYWLSHCEGFRVDAAEGRIGVVECVQERGPDGVPLLSVRGGRLGTRLLTVSTADVAFIVPRATRIWLASPVRLIGSEPG
jgi:hypothetical protein